MDPLPFRRYAIFYVPEEPPLAEFGAAWFGWDIRTGRIVTGPDLPDLPLPREALVEVPRRYGLHGTLKAPFRIAEGSDEAALARDLETLAEALPPAKSGGLGLAHLSRFWALTPSGDTTAISLLAAGLVSGLDHHRAPLTDAEIARRRRAALSEEEDRLMLRWGYPYVMDRFRFHVTLTGPVPETPAMAQALDALWTPLCAPYFVIDRVGLVGEGPDGMFRLIRQVQLRG